MGQGLSAMAEETTNNTPNDIVEQDVSADSDPSKPTVFSVPLSLLSRFLRQLSLTRDTEGIEHERYVVHSNSKSRQPPGTGLANNQPMSPSAQMTASRQPVSLESAQNRGHISSDTLSSNQASSREDVIGTLACLPREIRQIIYGYALDITEPVFPKKERITLAEFMLKKPFRGMLTEIHSMNCRMMKSVGVRSKKYLAGSSKVSSGDPRESNHRFDLFLVSRTVKTEASWVLYNQGHVLLDMEHFLVSCHPHGREIEYKRPLFEESTHAKRLYLMSARFRYVVIDMPSPDLHCSCHLTTPILIGSVVRSISKAWKKSPELLTLEVPHVVTIRLAGIFKLYLLRRRPEDDSDENDDTYDTYDMFANNRKDDAMRVKDFESMLSYFEELLPPQSHSKSKWKIMAEGVRDKQVVEDDEVTIRLRKFEAYCEENGIEFEATP